MEKNEVDFRAHRDLTNAGFTPTKEDPTTYERQLENGRWEKARTDKQYTQSEGEQGWTQHY